MIKGAYLVKYNNNNICWIKPQHLQTWKIGKLIQYRDAYYKVTNIDHYRLRVTVTYVDKVPVIFGPEANKW